MATEVLGPLLAGWLAAVEARLTAPVGRATIMPGNSIVEDDCCEGQLHIRIVSIVGASALSRPAMQPCLPLYQVRVGIGVTRCAHTVDDAGNAPTPAEMAADALQTYQDRADIVEAIVCDIWPEIRDHAGLATLRIEDWLPTTVQGGCVGGEITLTFGHILCTPCEETP